MKTNILPSFDFLRYAENSVKSFNENLNELENHSLAKEMAFLYSLQTLSRYMRTREHYFKEPHFDTEKLVNFAHEILGNKVQTYIKRQRIGIIVHGLILFGCSRKAAILALSKWLLMAETKIKDAHNQYRKSKSSANTKEDFLKNHGWYLYEEINDILDWPKRPFPEDCKKTKMIFDNFFTACSEADYELQRFADS